MSAACSGCKTMEYSTLRLCAVAVTAASAAMLMRELRREFEIPVRLTATVLLMAAVFAMAQPVAQYLSGMLGASPLAGEAAAVIIRAFGIAMLTRTAADICREMGAASVASALEVAGKLEIVILSLPLISTAMELVQGLLEAV